ncbi:hypothetical protein KsCSTR_29560 [Candidatus Kuenenia stuttgartiensis]|uniref:Uncharacterized protein n=1 Tax=Kuenenia stuttgartiensis TaxID=174633 RepID=A0A2C9CK30_KUEST|nr:hypothetical protein KsCSTR_29560 [Candidatus Kuenenia stuttgartiensis]SOH05958.1 hypothetical protein KSMBR1_3484 [Candidatus Kuenenia stuttgartiensis]
MKNIAKKYSKRQPKIKAEMSGKGLTQLRQAEIVSLLLPM